MVIYGVQGPGQRYIYIGLARTIYTRYFWQGNHQKYGHIRCIYIRFWPTLKMTCRGMHPQMICRHAMTRSAYAMTRRHAPSIHAHAQTHTQVSLRHVQGRTCQGWRPCASRNRRGSLVVRDSARSACVCVCVCVCVFHDNIFPYQKRALSPTIHNFKGYIV